jgi:hypothetical protein
MKKLVKESINFERGLGAKQSLGIGGFVPGEQYLQIYNEFIKNYKEFINSLVGKTISGEMEIWFNYQPGWNFGRKKNYRVKVSSIDKINYGDPAEKLLAGSFQITGEDGKRYLISPRDKIWVDNES